MFKNEFAELASRTMESRAHRPDRTAYDLRNLLVTILLDVGENDNRALVRRERVEGLGHRLAHLPFDVIVDGLDR
jgi:hypothetical protein